MLKLEKIGLILLCLHISIFSFSQTTSPFSGLLQDRFSTVMMLTSTTTCEARFCDTLEGCNQTILDEQTDYINTARANTSDQVSEEIQVACAPNEGSGYETQTVVDLSRISLPFKIYKVKTCQPSEHYIAGSQLEGLPQPYEIIQELFITNSEQKFNTTIGGDELEVDLEQLLLMIFVAPRDYNFEVDGHRPCGEIVCGQYCGTCSHDERIRQDQVIEYLIRETEVLDISSLDYPVTLHRLCICGGRSFWAMEEELYVFSETPYKILETIVVTSSEASVVIPDIPTNEDIKKDITFDLVHPTCDEPTSGSILIRVGGNKVGVLNQYSIDGGASYHEASLFKDLVKGIYNIQVSTADESLAGIIEIPIVLKQTCEEKGKEKCGDGIDNDEDGLVDCEDEGCVELYACTEDICELLDVISPEIEGINHVVLSVLEDGDPEPANRKLEKLGLNKDEYLEELRSFSEISYEFIEQYGSDRIEFRDTAFLYLDDELEDIFDWRQKLILDIPFNNGSSIIRKTKRNKNNQKNSSSECPQIATPRSLCADFSFHVDLCPTDDDNVIAGIFISGGAGPYKIVIHRIKTLNFEFVSLSIPFYSKIKVLTSHSNEVVLSLDSFEEYLVSVKDKNGCSISTKVRIGVNYDYLDNRIINVERGRCFSLSELKDRLACGHIYDQENICIVWSSSIYDTSIDEICPTREGEVIYSVSIGGEVIAEGSIEIRLSNRDLNNNGQNDEDDPCDFGFSSDFNNNGIPDECDCSDPEYVEKYSLGNADIDNDGILNCLDDDVDGDGVINAYDPDVDGDGIPNGRDNDIDGDGIGNNVDADADGDGYFSDDPFPLGTDTEDCETVGDQDGDGLNNAEDPDCSIQVEICCGGKDEDQDGLIDEADPDCQLSILSISLSLSDPNVTDGIAFLTVTSDADLLSQNYKACIDRDCRALYSGLRLSVKSADYNFSIVTEYNCNVQFEISEEICDNTIDDDGDGYVDCDDLDCVLGVSGQIRDNPKKSTDYCSGSCPFEDLTSEDDLYKQLLAELERNIADELGDLLRELKELEEYLLECSKPYNGQGIVPKCIWDRSPPNPNLALVSGMIDGVYIEGEEIAKLIANAPQYVANIAEWAVNITIAKHLGCNPEILCLTRERVDDLIGNIEENSSNSDILSWLREKRSQTSISFLTAWDKGCESLAEIELFLNIFKELIFSYKTWEAIYNELEMSFRDELIGLATNDNVAYYELGRAIVTVGSIFTGIGAVSKINKVRNIIDKIKGLTSAGRASFLSKVRLILNAGDDILDIRQLLRNKYPDLPDIELDQLLDDFGDNIDFLKKFLINENLLGAWKRYDKFPSLRSNGLFLERSLELSEDLLDQLDTDLLNDKWKDELAELFGENPDDLHDIWLKLKEDAAYHWEVARSDGYQAGSRWEKWSQREFFKAVTKKGKEFELELLNKMKTRTGIEYVTLRNIVADLDERRLLSQVQFCLPGRSPPCSMKGEFFIADQIWVKFDEFDEVVDMIVVDAKLSRGTNLTPGQTAAKNHVGGDLNYKPLKTIEFDEVGDKLPNEISQPRAIRLKGFYKAYGDGDKTFIDVE